MITKKEKLLIQPWINQKYEEHRQKIQNARATIDDRPPQKHPHIQMKWKKTQRERERLENIEKENRRLLQRLSEIMVTSRISNIWHEPPPNFLHRETLYPTKRSASAIAKPAWLTPYQTSPTTRPQSMLPSLSNSNSQANSRKTSAVRCVTCTGNPYVKVNVIPEPRIPWPVSKQSFNTKLIKHSQQASHQCCPHCC